MRQSQCVPKEAFLLDHFNYMKLDQILTAISAEYVALPFVSVIRVYAAILVLVLTK